MKQITHILIISLLLLLSVSCRTVKHTATPVFLHDKDSIRVEIVERIITDTVYVKVAVPAESSRQVVRDSTSHLETTVAISDAWLLPDGSLGHTLINKDADLTALVPLQHKERDNNNIKVVSKEIPVPYPERVEVERDFTTWERIKLGTFWYLLIVSCFSVLWMLKKVFFMVKL